MIEAGKSPSPRSTLYMHIRRRGQNKIITHLLVFVSEESESERSKLVAIAFVELVLILHPVKTQCVKERAQRLHHQKHSHRCKDEDEDPNDKDEYIVETVAG